MIGRIVAGELTRLRRRSVVVGWFGVTAVFAVLINFVMFRVVHPGAAPTPNGPGVIFPDYRALIGEHGIVAGLSAASSFFGVTALSFWALATASDHSTGLVRILVSAQPRRGLLLLGKWLALAVFSAVATLVALVVNLLCAPGAAAAGGYSPHDWGRHLLTVVAGAAVNLFLSLLVWGTIGLALATLTRSAGVAIGVGIGYVLLLESVIKATAASAGTWLPGTTISALAHGGTAELGYRTALILGVAYTAVASAAAALVFRRRDITD